MDLSTTLPCLFNSENFVGKYNLNSYFIKKLGEVGSEMYTYLKIIFIIYHNFLQRKLTKFLLVHWLVGFSPEDYLRVIWLYHSGENAKKSCN